jgi:nitrite reductase (NADH) small subunit
MATERCIGGLVAIPPGEGRNFDVGGIAIAVFRTHADDVFATQTRCPHRAGPLADGLIGGTTLLCPLHELAFDLRTGAGVGHDACLTVYPARVDADGAMWVTV